MLLPQARPLRAPARKKGHKLVEIELEKYQIRIGNHLPLVFIGGPCVLEPNQSYIETIEGLKEICGRLGIPYIFKSSYDKANRSSISSYRGPGLFAGEEIFAELKARFNVPILTDVHSVSEIEQIGDVVDIIQIPAFLSRQTDMVASAAKKGKPVNVKKGQFLSPWDCYNIIEKFRVAGGADLIITERGTTFGYNNLVVDMRSFHVLKSFGYPVCFDATHSVQLPGGQGKASGGQREFVLPLSLSAVAQGIAALFWEVHPRPDEALSDGPNMLPLSVVSDALKEIKALDTFVKSRI